MFKTKLIKEYTYTTICDIDFNVLEYFDEYYGEPTYSLWFEDHDYCTREPLVEFEQNLTDEQVDKEIKSFMLNHICSEVSCHIDDNNYKGWTVKVIEGSGLCLSNERENKCFRWRVYDDEDYEPVKNEIIERLDFLNQTK